MRDFSGLTEHVKNILPTPAMWLVTTSTLSIAIPIAALPGYLKEVWPELHIPEVLLFQAALISTTLFFGAFVVLLLSLNYIKTLKKSIIATLNEPENQHTVLEFKETTATWVNETSGLRYCAKCKSQNITSPLQNQQYGWKCPVCKTYCPDPMRPSPPAKIWIPD